MSSKNTKKRKRPLTPKQIVERRVTFTKRWVAIILTMSIVWITWSYMLATAGREEIAKELSESVITIIIATFIPYLCKSYFETFAQEKNRIKEKQMDLDYDVQSEEEAEAERQRQEEQEF